MADYDINAVTRRVVYDGSSGLGPYAFSFEILATDDITVYFNASVLTITTDYTVTINANGTGSINIVTGGVVPSTPVAADQITIVGARDIERTTDFVTAGDLRASALNEQLDGQIIMIQQVAEENQRGMRAPVYDPALVQDGGVVDMTLPTKASRAGKTLAFDSNGNPIVGEDIGNWRGDWAASVSYTVRDLVKDPTNSNVYRVNTAHTSSGSAPISSNADVAKFDLVVDAAAAGASAAAAAASAAEAAADAILTAADVVSTNADVLLTNADVVLTNADVVTAGNSAEAAQNAQAAAEAALDLFDDAYLGAKASDPTLDNDGNALQDGALYFNTTDDVMKVYDLGTTTWLRLTPTVANQNNINTVAGISADVTTVAGDSADIQAVAADATDIGTVATNIANVNTVAGDIANVNTVATNIADVNNFASTYRIGATDPTTSLDEGDLFYNTTSNSFKYYNGSAWAAVESGLTDVVSDTTPQLGGNLDSNGNDINFGDDDKAVFGAGSDLQIYHDGSNSYVTDSGTGDLEIRANEFLVKNTAGTGTGIHFDPNTSGEVKLYHNNQEKLKTTAKGVTVTGTAIATTQTASITGSTTLDFGTYQNFILTLTGSITLANPSTEQVGQSGFITFIQTGGYTVSLGTDYETAGGAGITLSASGTDVVPYIVAASGRILLGTPQLAFA